MIGFIERVIEIISPSWALKRGQYRRALSTVCEKRKPYLRKYSGAQKNERDKYWRPQNLEADGEIIPDWGSLVARSRDLVRNNPWAKSIINAFLNNVVGPTGIIPQVKLKDKKKRQEWQQLLTERLDGLDYTRKSNHWEIQRLLLKQLLEAGEAFARIIVEIPKRGNGFIPAVRIQLIEPDRIYSYSDFNEMTRNEIRQGIEIDKETGEHVAYYVNEHPGAYRLTFRGRTDEKRILDKDMIHLFLRERPDQTRGVPIFAAIIQYLHDIGEMLEAELVSNRVASCLAVFIRQNPQYGKETEPVLELEPGLIGKLQPGEDIQVVDPRRPSPTFEAFMSFALRAIAAAIGLAYETVAKDYKQFNFSASRLSKLDERKTYRVYQQFMIHHYCKRITREILEIEELTRRVPDFPIAWRTPGFEWVDPEKEVSANILAVNANIKSKSEVITEHGGDIEDVYEDRAMEVEQETQLGIANEN